MRRGDLVIAALRGEQGKPRPALVVQSDLFDALPAVTALPVTSTTVAVPLPRVAVRPSPQDGLGKPSQIMVDKPGGVIGRLDDAALLAVDGGLAVFPGPA